MIEEEMKLINRQLDLVLERQTADTSTGFQSRASTLRSLIG